VAENEGFGSFRHLALRFFGALDPRGPAPESEVWALGWLLPGERQLWRRMSGPDRRHAAGVARDVAGRLGWSVSPGDGGQEPPREVMASALLHDVGKVESGLGTFARVGVTLAAMGLGRERLVAGGGALQAGGEPGGRSGGLRRRIRDYLTHDRIGADLLRQAGSHPDTVAWAAEHHLPPEPWTLDRRVAEALKAADED
jgi:hypothetical protein